MRKIIVGIIFLGLLAGVNIQQGYASDWDKAGKVLTIIEGARILTGGKVDIIGTLTGTKQDVASGRYEGYHRGDQVRGPRYSRRVWIPHLVCKREYIPQHEEYSERYGRIIVEGHYITYQVEDGGHWASRY